MSASRTRRDHARERRARVRAMQQPKLPPRLHAVWRDASLMWSTLCDVFETPASLAACEYIPRHEHRMINDWVYHLELLIHRLVLVAALALNIVLRPIAARAPRVRKRRHVLLWPARPEAWPARFRMMRRRGHTGDRDRDRTRKSSRTQPAIVPSFPLARRLEAARRVLANPDAYIRRFAIRLGRIAERNARANAPRYFRLRTWADTPRRPTTGWQMISEPMNIIYPLACDSVDAWNEAAEPD